MASRLNPSPSLHSNIPKSSRVPYSPRSSIEKTEMEQGKYEMNQFVSTEPEQPAIHKDDASMCKLTTRSMFHSSARVAEIATSKLTTANVFPKKTSKGINPVDISILYEGSPIRMESTTSSVAPPYHPRQRKSPTYLDLYRHQRQHEEHSISGPEILSSLGVMNDDSVNNSSGEIKSCKTSQSLCVKSSDSAFNESLEWDYASHQCMEVCTQTSPTVITVDRASSNFPIESISKESLIENQSKPLSVIYMDESTTLEESDDLNEEHTVKRISPPSLHDWQTEMMPKLNTSSGGKAVEILPSPVPLTLNELKMDYTSEGHFENNEPAVIFPLKSSLIFLPSYSKHGKVLKSSYEISNSTSFLQGYKILVNSVANDRLHVSPNMGLISPHGGITVHFTTNSNEYTNKLLAKFRIAVKTFRVHCDDPNKLKEYYSKLEEQHPELIQMKTIDNVLVWKNNDLPEMMRVIDSVSDLRERDALKEQLHDQLSNDNILTGQKPSRLASPEQQLNNIKMAMIVANQNLNNVFLELNAIRNTLGFLSFIGMVVYGISFILPAFIEEDGSTSLTAEIAELPLPPQPGSVEQTYRYFSSLWEDFLELLNSVDAPALLKF